MFGEAVVVCDIDSCQKRFLWTHKEVDLAPHPVIGLVLQARDMEKFPHAFGFERLDSFFRVHFSESEFQSRVHVSQPQRRMEVARDFQSLNLLAELMVSHRQILFSLAIVSSLRQS